MALCAVDCRHRCVSQLNVLIYIYIHTYTHNDDVEHRNSDKIYGYDKVRAFAVMKHKKYFHFFHSIQTIISC